MKLIFRCDMQEKKVLYLSDSKFILVQSLLPLGHCLHEQEQETHAVLSLSHLYTYLIYIQCPTQLHHICMTCVNTWMHLWMKTFSFKMVFQTAFGRGVRVILLTILFPSGNTPWHTSYSFCVLWIQHSLLFYVAYVCICVCICLTYDKVHVMLYTVNTCKYSLNIFVFFRMKYPDF